eukprot:scaffold46735_cov52-Phaeocystis_antarctica.AAC.3
MRAQRCRPAPTHHRRGPSYRGTAAPARVKLGLGSGLGFAACRGTAAPGGNNQRLTVGVRLTVGDARRLLPSPARLGLRAAARSSPAAFSPVCSGVASPASEDAVDGAAPLQASIATARAPCSQTDDAAPSL